MESVSLLRRQRHGRLGQDGGAIESIDHRDAIPGGNGF
jgi:hypothetical protein